MSTATVAVRSIKSAQRMWRRRVRMLPVAFVLLIGAAALGVHLRAYVDGLKPRLDVSEFVGVRDSALDLSRNLVKRTERRIPMHDLGFLKPVLSPKAVIASVLPVQDGAAETNKPVEPPPVPRLEGIMFSRTEPSLAVFDDKAAGKGDVVAGWRVMLIEPERVRIINDESGVVKEVILYEKERKE